MSNFAIMRLEKRKDIGSVRRCAAHHLRTVDTPNADPQGSISVLAGSPDSDEVTAIIAGSTKPLMKRKDAIRCIDVFCGASPEFFAQGGSIREFEAVAMKWAGDTFGTDNIALAVTHEDETTPHVQMLITPITPQGKLSASHWLDGPKKLRDLQNSFALAMKPLGLERGVEGSKAKHESVKTWYGKLEPAMKNAEKVIEQAAEIEISQAAREAKIAVEKNNIAQDRDLLLGWESELKIASDAVRIEKNKLADREAEIVKKETFLQKLGVELERQKNALIEAFNTLPAAIQSKLSAIFKRETKTVPAADKPVVKAALKVTDLILPGEDKKPAVKPPR